MSILNFKYLILLTALLPIESLVACQCPVTNLSDQELRKYDIIFKGTIKMVNLIGNKGKAVYAIDELYKGSIPNNFSIFFNANDDCKLELRVGDEWLIYTNYLQIDNAKLDFCSRSRKFIKNQKEDFFAVTTGISYDEECRFLQNKLGLHKCLKNSPTKVENRNKIPNKNQLAIILICSLLGIVFFYSILHKFFKY